MELAITFFLDLGRRVYGAPSHQILIVSAVVEEVDIYMLSYVAVRGGYIGRTVSCKITRIPEVPLFFVVASGDDAIVSSRMILKSDGFKSEAAHICGEIEAYVNRGSFYTAYYGVAVA